MVKKREEYRSIDSAVPVYWKGFFDNKTLGEARRLVATLEQSAKLKDGKRTWSEDTLRSLGFGDGRMIGFFAMVTLGGFDRLKTHIAAQPEREDGRAFADVPWK